MGDRMAILLLFLFQAALTSADRRAVDLQREKATLLALKQGLTLPSSAAAALADWNESNSNVCSFTGVTCDWQREHVVGLSLANMDISGAIPAVIGELSHLRRLDVSNNNISGQIPTSLCGMKSLERLAVSNNSLTGEIPACIGSLAGLRNLFLQGNKLSGAIPQSLGGCFSLFRVDLSSNLLTGPLP